MAEEYMLKMVGMDKRFAGVHALRDVTFNVLKGEVHVLMGENGAGKSTLMKILAGVYSADKGEIYIEDVLADINSPVQARAAGVSMIHQELSMCRNMMIAENIFRGEEPTKKPFGFVDFNKMLLDAEVVLESMNIGLDVSRSVGSLSLAEQQMVEIAGAVSRNAKVVIMDEPTSSLTTNEVTALFKIIGELKAKGTSVIYISHRMEETFAIGDRVTVLRDGQYVGTREVKNVSRDELITMMVGRPIEDVFQGKRVVGGDVILEVKGIKNKKLRDVSFQLRQGEILGFSGLIGSGRTELMRCVFGLDPYDEGKIYLYGKEVNIKNPRQAMDAGIGMVPEDRRATGLVQVHSVSNNLTIAVLHKFIKGIWVNHRIEEEIVETFRNALTIRMASPEQRAGNLSGGNQQKVVISKWLATEPKILILDEPTRGIDVGTKAEVYQLIRKLASEGVSIIFVSSELPEIVNLSSRVVIMHEGRIAGILDSEEEELTQTKIMQYAIGEYKHAG